MIGNFGYGGFGWIGMILGLVIMIALIVGFVFLVVWAVQRMSGNSVHTQLPHATDLSAKDIAKARYAKGEISREEYQQLLSDIGL
jgi:putative membrane protein